MRMLATALVVGFLAVPIGGAQLRAPDLAHEGLKGPVRNVREEVAPLVPRRGRLVEGKKQLAAVVTFDSRGDVVERTRYVGGRTVERSIHRYVPDGSLVCETQVRSTGSVYTLVAITADTQRDDEGAWRTDRHVLKTTYGESGLAAETVAYDSVGTAIVARTREVFEYDGADRLVATTRHSLETGAVVGCVRYGYSPAGALAWMDVRDGANALERRVEYSDYVVDARGNWVRRTEVELAAGNVRERRAVYRTIGYYDDAPRVGAREARLVAKAAPNGGGRASAAALAKAHTTESEGMGDSRGLFLAVREASIANPKKPCPAHAGTDIADHSTDAPASDEPAVDAR